MRDHEVPTHVQAEDRVLLWFTFPQIVAMTAVCALSYGAYRYAPVGPAGVRMALAVVLGLAGVAMIVGKIGGRQLPLAAADLLRFGLGARRYAGPPTQLVRSEPPTPAQADSGPPAPARHAERLRLMVRKARHGLRRLRKKKRKDGERRNGRMRWFGKRRRSDGGSRGHGHRAEALEAGRRKPRRGRFALVIVIALAVAAAAVPQAALADGPDDGGWGFDEIGFEIPEPVPGRRLFIEGLAVSGDRAGVTLRAATDLDLRVRAYGGRQGRSLRFWGSASLDDGERIAYSLPLSGEAPSLTFSWKDTLGQAGAVTLKDEQLPYPLPSADRELCDVRVKSLGWTPGSIEGTVESECASDVEEAVSLRTVAGHESVTETAAMDAEVTAVTGTVTVMVGGSRASVPFVRDGDTRFSLSVERGEAVHAVAIRADVRASLKIALPPLTRLTHHPARVQERTESVSMTCPEVGRWVEISFPVRNHDGTWSTRHASRYASFPARVISEYFTFEILHPERVQAEVVERSPITRSRSESVVLSLNVGADDSFKTLVLPEPEEKPEPAEQTPLTEREFDDLFDGRRP